MKGFMKTVRAFSIIFIAAVIFIWFLRAFLLLSVPVGQVGVRTQEYGILGSKGVKKRDYGPGWHRDFGPIDSWVVFDSTIQTLEMTKDPSHGDEMGRDDVKVQSADGYAVSVDVTLKYRIKENGAHKLYQDTGSGTKYKAVVRTKTEKVCMDTFGKMATEDFYNPKERVSREAEAEKALESILDAHYIEVVDLLMREVTFDPAYEGKIRKKKLNDQNAEVNVSLEKAAAERGKRQVIEATTKKIVKVISKEKEKELAIMKAKTDLQIAEIEAKAGKYAKQKKADADLSLAQANAESTKLIKSAEAKGEELRNAALAGTGGSTLVALEAARNLKVDRATISTAGIDLIDIKKMAEKLGAEK